MRDWGQTDRDWRLLPSISEIRSNLAGTPRSESTSLEIARFSDPFRIAEQAVVALIVDQVSILIR
jgi:hypothetical protein